MRDLWNLQPHGECTGMRANVLLIPLFLWLALIQSDLVGQATPSERVPAAALGFSVFGPWSDHMVLQRDRPLRIAGRATPGASVQLSASFLDTPLQTLTNGRGHWNLELKAQPAGGPHRIALSCGDAQLIFEDVLFGEVWLCSGQSNMEQRIQGPARSYHRVLHAEAEIAAAEHPRIRFLTVPREPSAGRVTTLNAKWQRVAPQSVAELSGVSYFFGRDLLRALDVPIGLVVCAYGGTRAEAWMRPNSLAEFEELQPELKAQEALARAEQPSRDGRAQEAFHRALREKDQGSSEERGLLAFARARWKSEDCTQIQLPEDRESSLFKDFDGVIWFQKEIDLPADFLREDLELALGPIDDLDAVFWNGQRIGGIDLPGNFGHKRSYAIPREIVRSSRALIAIRVIDISGPGGFNPARDEFAIKKAVGSGSLDLRGHWNYRKGPSMAELPAPPSGIFLHANAIAALSEGMLEPLGPLRCRGVIWYQGESNRNTWIRYQRLFPALIRDWRSRFETPGMPFLFVQIAPFQYGDDADERTALLRLAQAEALKLDHTGMVATGDIGNPRDIHPTNKQAVGRRLADLALALVHGQTTPRHGPRPHTARPVGKDLWVHFHKEGEPAEAESVLGVEIETEAGRFEACPASLKRGLDGRVALVIQGAGKATAVRYAHAMVPPDPFFGRNSLPAEPFWLEIAPQTP